MYIFPVLMGNACVKNKSTAISKIDNSGKIEVCGKRDKYSYDNITMPFFRGVAYFIFGLYLFFKNLILAEENFSKEKIVKNGKIKISESGLLSVIVLIAGIVFGLFAFVFVPYFSFYYLGRLGYNYFLICLIAASLRVATLAIILLIIRFIPVFKQFYRHNASCNLVVKSSENYHLSTNFLTFVLTSFFILLWVGCS